MFPTYRDGEHILVDQDAYLHFPPEPDDIVLALHPFKKQTWMIKRVKFVDPDGRLFLIGDNRWESSDSRSYGTLHPERIKGKVLGKA
jgi:signal peptidase I